MSSKRKINRNAVYVISFLLITIISLFYKTVLSGILDKPATIIMETTESGMVSESIEITSDTSEILISVYLCGEVMMPGVYQIVPGTILNDVVNMAGGLTSEANRNHINLVYEINHNVSIYIPSENENFTSEIVWGNEETGSDNSLVNINTASIDELISLPGIGQSTANAIIEYRETNSFSRIEDIMNVTGIGESKFNAIRDFICV